MEAKPLSKEIYNEAIKLGVKKITLAFSGGSDEGFLDINISPPLITLPSSFVTEIESWAWSVYDYSGAGDGNDFGDNIEYDLENKKVSTNLWYMSRQETPYESKKIKFS
jgi:hypothetical protein